MFQSLTGRLQTQLAREQVFTDARFNPSQVGYKQNHHLRQQHRIRSFNPSQVGYKRVGSLSIGDAYRRFNPSQVGYKLILKDSKYILLRSFNPSQVGYKPPAKSRLCPSKTTFQSLTGRLQTLVEC